MADTAGSEDATITFHVKASGGQKYTVSLPLSTTTADLKNKLASEEYANVPASAQRLIYSGKVLKDHETLASHNVKEGNTMHLVKSAASNQRQNPAAQSSSPSSAPSGGTTQATGIPQNLASGTGNDPLAGLTGARYAGFARLPNASMFQNSLNPEDFLRELENPNFQQMMREAMNNPQVQDMIINQNPHLRAMGPSARQMLQSEQFRRMMTNPQSLRSMMRMQQALGGMGAFGGDGGQGAFPAPGVTNTTESGNSENPSNNPSSPPMPGRSGMDLLPILDALRDSMQALNGDGENGPGARGAGNAQDGQQQQNPPNPFAAFGGGDLGANPFASLFAPPFNNPSNPTGTTQNQQNDAGNNSSTPNTQNQPNQQQQNPFAVLFDPGLFPQRPAGGAGGGGVPGLGAPPPVGNPFDPSHPIVQNPELADGFWQALGEAFNGRDSLRLSELNTEARAADVRPPEERFAEQLRQLNEMGFYDFDRNVQALRRTGGNVNGAIEYLLSHPSD